MKPRKGNSASKKTYRTLNLMHRRAFQAWRQLTLDQQRNDFERFLRSAEGSSANLTADRTEGFSLLAPIGASADETALFVVNLATILTPPAPPESGTRIPAVQPVPAA